MVSVMSLWMPILVSAVFVFIASSIIHMFLGYHKNDTPKLARQDDVMAALRPFAIPPGDYMVPRCDTMAEMKTPEFDEKMKKGPVIVMTVMPNGPMSMGSNLVLWFLYCLAVSAFAAFVVGHIYAPGAHHYRGVFRFVGCTAFAAYAMALPQQSIWYRRKWSTTVKSMFDGLIFAALTAGTFGWLWPR